MRKLAHLFFNVQCSIWFLKQTRLKTLFKWYYSATTVPSLPCHSTWKFMVFVHAKIEDLKVKDLSQKLQGISGFIFYLQLCEGQQLKHQILLKSPTEWVHSHHSQILTSKILSLTNRSECSWKMSHIGFGCVLTGCIKLSLKQSQEHFVLYVGAANRGGYQPCFPPIQRQLLSRPVRMMVCTFFVSHLVMHFRFNYITVQI